MSCHVEYIHIHIYIYMGYISDTYTYRDRDRKKRRHSHIHMYNMKAAWSCVQIKTEASPLQDENNVLSSFGRCMLNDNNGQKGGNERGKWVTVWSGLVSSGLKLAMGIDIYLISNVFRIYCIVEEQHFESKNNIQVIYSLWIEDIKGLNRRKGFRFGFHYESWFILIQEKLIYYWNFFLICLTNKWKCCE